MLDPDSILRLYANVLHNDIVVNGVSKEDIRQSVRTMAQVYAPESSDFESNVLKFLNFNDVACRCAYLHKYAPLHTYVAFDATLKMLQRELSMFRDLVNDRVLKLCSLGGGPGSDVVGVISALRVVFKTLRASVSIVDCMDKWESTFEEVLKELKFGGYGPDWYYFVNGLQWNYIGANLLCKMSDAVNKAVGSADLITMVKFISASVCTNTEEMVDKIFRVMKVGALVLFIDNAAGGFTELIERSSRRNGLVPMVGPLKHVPYAAEALKVDRFGYGSCFQTRVTVALLRKGRKQQMNLEVVCDPNRLLTQNGPRRQPRREKLDFVVFDHRPSDRLDVNLLPCPELNNTAGGAKCAGKKLVNDLRASPVTSSNVAANRTFKDFSGSSNADMSPRKPNPPFTQYRPRPVTNTSAQRYQAVPQGVNRAQPQDDSDEVACSCCVLS